MSSSYKIAFDERVKDDIKDLKREKKAVRVAFDEMLDRLEKRPSSYGQLDSRLSGLRKAKFKKIFRIIYALDERTQTVYIIAVGKRSQDEYDIYNKVRLRRE
ncbi:MAG TPA: type II toxin-antitoxin system RelE/ParE family toxin [Coleofasciculaceae cyanobacterium]